MGALLAVPAALLPLWLGISCRTGQKPDVLLVTIDTLRADRVGCYGDSGAFTPNMNRLAQEGIVFDDAVTPVPMTLPSHSTILTGLLPLNHGVRNNGSYSLPAGITTLGERFLASGYRTAGFISSYVLHSQFGIGRGFQVYDDTLVTERAGAETVARAIRWLDAGGNKPYFLWVHLYEPHRPWTPPMPYLSLPLRTGYEREVAAADGALGTLLDHLRSQRRLDRTIVAVVGDHGEGLDDHGEEEHGVFLYRETIHVPWILRLPGGKDAGRRVPDLVSTMDLAPTLCALAGVKPLKEIDGFSLTPALSGRPLPPRKGVYLETLLPKENYGWSPLFAYQSKRWKWIRAPQCELYDLGERPPERTNLAAARPDTAALLDAQLDQIMRSSKAKSGSAQTMSQEVLERLRSLGYLAGDNASSDEKENLPDPKSMVGVQRDLEEAKGKFEFGQSHRAIAPFRRVLAVNDQNVTAKLGLASALNKTAQYAEAEVIYRRILRQRPRNETALNGLADALFGQEKWADAYDLYVCKVDVTLAPPMKARAAICQAKRGDWSGAQQTLAQAEASFPGQRGYLEEISRILAQYRTLADRSTLTDDEALQKADLALGLRLLSEGERLLSRPSASATIEIRRLKLLGEMYSFLDRPDRALDVLARLTSLDGRTADRELMKAVLQVQADLPEEALASSSKILKEETLAKDRLAVLQYNRCRALIRLHRAAEAMQALRAAVDNGYSDLHSFLTDPDLDTLRESPDFLALINRVSSRSASGQQKDGGM